MMTSLIFRVLDQHVIHGLADDLAVADERGAMSYAELLHESASVAGALANLGVAPGSGLQIDLAPGREQVVAVLACARIGAVPQENAELRLAGSPPVLHLPDTEVTWDLLIHAGRVDPAPAPAQDAEGYAELLRAAYGDIFATLEAGGTVS
jgi:hypothetical protein